jgi:hypothetical protein
MRRFRLPEIVLGFLLATSLWAVVSIAQTPPLDQPIKKTETRANTNGDEHKITKTLRERLSIIWERTWDDPVAFYTFVLGIFTASLATVAAFQIYFLIRADKTTRIAAKAAEKSAETLPSLERAHIFIIPSLMRVSIPARGIDRSPIQNGKAMVTYKFVNHGKTPAVIKSVEVHFDLLTTAPDNESHLPNIILSGEKVLEAKDDWSPNNGSILKRIGEDEHAGLKRDDTFLWFYGSIVYDDIFGLEHVTRFRWRYDGGSNQFLGFGSKPYNERT